MAHTPGPYELYSEGRTVIVGDAATHTDLAEFFYRDEHTVSTTRDEALANANLFMASGDMLAALKEIAAGCIARRPGHVGAHLNRTKAEIEEIALAAIERATPGEQS